VRGHAANEGSECRPLRRKEKKKEREKPVGTEDESISQGLLLVAGVSRGEREAATLRPTNRVQGRRAITSDLRTTRGGVATVARPIVEKKNEKLPRSRRNSRGEASADISAPPGAFVRERGGETGLRGRSSPIFAGEGRALPGRQDSTSPPCQVFEGTPKAVDPRGVAAPKTKGDPGVGKAPSWRPGAQRDRADVVAQNAGPLRPKERDGRSPAGPVTRPIVEREIERTREREAPVRDWRDVPEPRTAFQVGDESIRFLGRWSVGRVVRPDADRHPRARPSSEPAPPAPATATNVRSQVGRAPG